MTSLRSAARGRFQPRDRWWPLLLTGFLAACSSGEAPRDGQAGRGPESETAAGSLPIHRAQLEGVEILDLPSQPGALAPNWAIGAAAPTLTWLSPRGTSGHALRFARRTDDGWSAPATVAEGDRFFANWADFPAAAQSPSGPLFAHWLEKNGDGTYAYGVQMARSDDGGASWNRIGSLHPDDDSETEHGFVSFTVAGDALQAFWLDGRNTARGEPMTLRTARVDGSGVGPGEELSSRVCDCCQTSAVWASSGPVVAYRGRTGEEIRDIAVRVQRDGDWQPETPVAEDGWKIPGCPVNGPAIAAHGDRVAVAWFTAASPEPRVRVAFSDDGGRTFGAATRVDDGRPLGRVHLVLEPASGAVAVSWMEKVEGTADVRLRRVTPRGEAGPAILGQAVALGRTSASRRSGFPRLTLSEGQIHAVWVRIPEGEDTPSLEALSLPFAALP